MFLLSKLPDPLSFSVLLQEGSLRFPHHLHNQAVFQALLHLFGNPVRSSHPAMQSVHGCSAAAIF